MVTFRILGMKFIILSFSLFLFLLVPSISYSEIQPYEYIIYENNGIVFAQNTITNNIDFQSNNASSVFQSVISANPSLDNGVWNKSILIKTGNYYLNKPINFVSQITFQGEGSGATVLIANQTMNSMITKSSTLGKIIIKDMFISGNGKANNALDLSDKIEASYHIIISNVDIEQSLKNNLILDGNEDSLLDMSTIANPSGSGKSIQWNVGGGNAWIRNTFVSGDMIIGGQQATIRDSTIEHFTSNYTTILQFDSVYWNTNTKYGNAIDLTKPVADIAIKNSYIGMSNNENFIIGTVQKNIRVENTFFDMGGNTGQSIVIPNQNNLKAFFFPNLLGTIHLEGLSFNGNIIPNQQNNEFVFYIQ